jgi:Cu2+-exporting ATPase
MKFEIVHELGANGRHPWRVRGRYNIPLTARLARAVCRELAKMPGITGVCANPLTRKILFFADTLAHRDAVINYLEHGFDWTKHTRITAEEVEELLTGESPAGAFIGIARFFLLRPLLPPFWRMIVSTASAVPFIMKGLRAIGKGRLNADALDASALLVSILMRDYRTVGMLTMLLALGEALESWTRQTSMTSLIESLALNVDTVWKLDGNGNETNVPLGQIKPGDIVVVRDGAAIPVDGIVESGNALVNQASMTGESIPVARERGGSVFAGTIVEAGSITVRVSEIGEGTRLHQVLGFIRQSEAEKSSLEAQYTRLADRVVPFTFGLAGLALLFSQNLARAASVLLVDYSCAIKLATPLAVLSAMRSGAKHGIAVKGGKYLEAVRKADTLVFDKTGTLTSAKPAVIDIIAAPGHERREILRTMACLEEHFPHPVSRAIVGKAIEEGLHHEEEHADVEYVVAHGIVSTMHGQRLCLGSRHYLEHDEGVDLSVFGEDIARESAMGHSLLFLSEAGKAAGMAVIADPLRPEAKKVIKAMRGLGISRIIMLTGDDERTARAIAHEAGITEFMAQVLPREKGEIIQRLEAAGRKVMMVGDGINDGAALSAASVGVAMGDGTDLARAVANVLLVQPNLEGLVALRHVSVMSVARIRHNFIAAIALNSLYLAGATFAGFSPALCAALHNLTTLGLAVNAIRPYQWDE